MTEPAPEVSVLVPCFNKAQYVEETLQSVYAQTLARWELIVVDDGSTDGSVEVLARHEGRARVVLGPNRGASAARQRALELARGTYVQYLDADDVLLPDALAHGVRALEASGADVAYGAYQRLVKRTDGSFARDQVVSLRCEDVDPDPEIACFTRFWLPPAALLYRRALLDRVPPWNGALPVIQDARYLQEAAFAGARFVQVPHVLALYREDADNSLSKRSKLSFARDLYTNSCEVEAIWRARGALRESQAHSLAEALALAARMTFRADDALFDACVARLETLGKNHRLAWPSIAQTLRSLLGKRGALAVLEALRKPGLP